jgi:hypothetical protein
VGKANNIRNTTNVKNGSIVQIALDIAGQRQLIGKLVAK